MHHAAQEPTCHTRVNVTLIGVAITFFKAFLRMYIQCSSVDRAHSPADPALVGKIKILYKTLEISYWQRKKKLGESLHFVTLYYILHTIKIDNDGWMVRKKVWQMKGQKLERKD